MNSVEFRGILPSLSVMRHKFLYSNIYPTRCNVAQFILSGNCSTCFGWYHHQSSGAQTTVSTASGICHTNSFTIAAGSSNGVTITSCSRYSCMRSWWWVEVPPETCRAVSRHNKLCNVASCWIYIGISTMDIRSLNTRRGQVRKMVKCRLNHSLIILCEEWLYRHSYWSGRL